MVKIHSLQKVLKNGLVSEKNYIIFSIMEFFIIILEPLPYWEDFKKSQ